MPRSTLHVAIIDDWPEDRDLARRALLQGSECRLVFAEAGNGEQGLAICRRTDPKPDVVLLDFDMPDMSAIEFLQALQGEADALPLPVVVLTGSQGDSVASAALIAGAQDFIAKSDVTPSNLNRTVRNAIERLRLLQQLAASEAHFRQMADNAPVLIWLSDPDRRRVWFNKPWLEFTGWPLEQARGEGWRDTLHPDDRGRYLQACAEAFDAGQPFKLEYRLRHHDASYRWILDHGAPHYAGKEFAGYIGSCIDITDRKRSEQMLEKARQSADTANRAKSAFLANMSHEIRTPMTAILGYADMLLAQIEEPREREYVDTIKRNAHYLIEIINDVLDLSKIEADKLEVVRERLSPAAVIADVLTLMQVRARDRAIGLTVEYRGKIPATIESDRIRLRQILINLIGNAIKFTDRGGVRLAVELLGDPRRPLLQFEVSDSGIGITPDMCRRLFEPFTQADANNTQRRGGTGLGLAISKRLITMLGGEISAVSEPGQGSTFTFTIATGPLAGVPLVDAGQTQAAQAAAQPEGAFHRLPGCRVLLADDHADIRNLIENFIETAGGSVTAVADGSLAVEAVERAEAQERPFEVVIMDMQMPVLDGYEATARLRAFGYTRPIIAVSASAMKSDRDRCLQAGCTDYLSKPIDRQRLLERVAHHARACAQPQHEHTVNNSRGRNGEEKDKDLSCRVLLVDDSADACKALQSLLSRKGYDVRTAHDGRSAMVKAREHHPEVVILDIGLPDTDGYQLVRQLRALDASGDTTYIALSGYEDSPEISRAAGFTHYLTKPASVSELVTLFPPRE